jgi:pyruvate dehydrogenase E1 component alpha subunit
VTADGSLAAAQLDAIDAEVLALIDRSVAAARAAAPPAEADLLTDVYATY